MKKPLLITALFALLVPLSIQAQTSGPAGSLAATTTATRDPTTNNWKLVTQEKAPGAATVALAGAGAGNVNNGVHRVKVELVTALGHTSPGTQSSAVTVTDKTVNGKIAISAIPTGSVWVTSRKVYMTLAGGSSYFLLSNGTIADNTTTTLTANDSDITLAAAAAMPTNNNTANPVLSYTGSSGAVSIAGVAAGPGGSSTHVQFNDGGGFGGVAQFTFTKPAAAETGKVILSGTALGSTAIADGAAASDILTVTGPTGQATSFNNNISKGGAGSNFTFTAGNGGDNADVNTNSSANHRGGLGGNLNFLAGVGGAGTTAPGVVRGASGGGVSFNAGNGGTAVNAIAGNGGGVNFNSGNGGITTAAAASGNAGGVTIAGGTGGNNSNAAGTAGNGGAISIDAGTAGANTGGAAAGTNGTVSIGTTNASALTIGRSSVTTTINGTTAVGVITQTSNSATAFESGPNGSTNPVLRLVNNTASQADGVSITGGAAGNGTTFTGLSSGSNAGFTFTPKGTGNFTLTTGDMALGTNRLTFSQGIIKSGTSGVLHARTTADTAYAHFAAASFRANDSSDNATMTMNLSGSGIFATISSGGVTWSNSATQSNSTIDTSLWRSAANVVGVGTSVSNTSGSIKALKLLTDTNCSDSAGAAACGSAAAGAFVMDAAATTVVVSTTSVTANSEIQIQESPFLNTRLSVTCNTTTGRLFTVTALTAGTSFTVTASAAPATNPACLTYNIVN